VVARPCKVSWELDYSLVCVLGPFAARGIRGKKSTPSIGWEVPVRSQRLASKELDRAQARDNDLRFFFHLVTIHMSKSCCCKLVKCFCMWNYMFMEL
jgi:hypothetical protein